MSILKLNFVIHFIQLIFRNIVNRKFQQTNIQHLNAFLQHFKTHYLFGSEIFRRLLLPSIDGVLHKHEIV